MGGACKLKDYRGILARKSEADVGKIRNLCYKLKAAGIDRPNARREPITAKNM